MSEHKGDTTSQLFPWWKLPLISQLWGLQAKMTEILPISLNLLLGTERSLCFALHLWLPGPLLYCVLLLCPLILRANFLPGPPNFPLGPCFIHNLPLPLLSSLFPSWSKNLCAMLLLGLLLHMRQKNGLSVCFHCFSYRSFTVKSVCSWNLHTCSWKHYWYFSNPNLQNKFSFMEIRQYLLSVVTLLSRTSPALWWGVKEHELGCEVEHSPSSSSLMVTVVTWAGLLFKPLFSQLKKGR